RHQKDEEDGAERPRAADAPRRRGTQREEHTGAGELGVRERVAAAGGEEPPQQYADEADGDQRSGRRGASGESRIERQPKRHHHEREQEERQRAGREREQSEQREQNVPARLQRQEGE